MIMEEKRKMKYSKICMAGLVAMVVVCFSGCGKTTDTENKNVTVEINDPQIENINVYLDNSADMLPYITNSMYSDVVYAASSVANDTFFNSKCTFYNSSREVIEQNSIRNYIQSSNSYMVEETNILDTVLSEVKEDSLDVVITNISKQLNQYSSIASMLVNNALKNNKAVSFIGVDFEPQPIFIIVIGSNDALSEYLESFKENPSVKKYSGEEKQYQTDSIENINYQIIANQSGINGIDYDDLEIVENGDYYTNVNDASTLQRETKGSFEKINLNYKPYVNGEYVAQKDDIEGTVNFTPETPNLVTVKSKDQRNAKYLGVQSLLYNDVKDNIGGKVKIKIPWDVVRGVKLSKLECSVETSAQYAKSGSKFKPVDFEKNYIKINIADGVLPEQGKWRVDDTDNSMIFNIIFQNAAAFPSKDGVLKLDIKIKQYDSISSVSQWIKKWDKEKVPNLLNLFNSLYTYQTEANLAENQFTVYIGTGTKSLYKRAELAAKKTGGENYDK